MFDFKLCSRVVAGIVPGGADGGFDLKFDGKAVMPVICFEGWSRSILVNGDSELTWCTGNTGFPLFSKSLYLLRSSGSSA